MIKLWDVAPGWEEGDEIPNLVISGEVKPGEKKGCVIVCPGGGYGFLADYEGVPVADWLSSTGVVGITLTYRVAPKANYAYTDIQRAIRYVRYNAESLGVDPDKIGVLGFSAGGHLSAYAGTHFDNGDVNALDPIERVSCRPNAMILCYPVITFGEYGHIYSLSNVVNREPTPEDIQIHSIERNIPDDAAPAFIWHTYEDTAVPVYNSLMMCSALKDKNIPCEMHIFPHGNHGMHMGDGDESVSQWPALCETWLKGLGFID